MCKNANRALHYDFYNVSPAGYLTITSKRLVVEANLTTATLPGVDRESIVRQKLNTFVLPEDQDNYSLPDDATFYANNVVVDSKENRDRRYAMFLK